jgi:hypothetical protein
MFILSLANMCISVPWVYDRLCPMILSAICPPLSQGKEMFIPSLSHSTILYSYLHGHAYVYPCFISLSIGTMLIPVTWHYIHPCHPTLYSSLSPDTMYITFTWHSAQPCPVTMSNPVAWLCSTLSHEAMSTLSLWHYIHPCPMTWCSTLSCDTIYISIHPIAVLISTCITCIMSEALYSIQHIHHFTLNA